MGTTITNSNTINKLFQTISGNVIKLISSIVIGFVIPYLLNVRDFGYYKIFTLYLTYCGFFHFGFIDGIYLTFAGKNYNELNKNLFKIYTKYLFYLQMIISICGVVVSIFLDSDKQFVILMLSINLIALNLTTYYQYISQATSRFNEYSTRLIILSALNILLVGIMYIFNIKDYKTYLVLTVTINYLLAFWYIYTYRDITFGSTDYREFKTDFLQMFKIGFPILIANLISIVLTSIDKQIIEIYYPLEVFSYYSFAYNIITLITTVTTSIGVVLFPLMSKYRDSINGYYSELNSIIIWIVIAGLSIYFPLIWIIKDGFLSKYSSSIPIITVVFPGLLISSSIKVIKQNIFNIKGHKFNFLIISLITLILTVIIILFIHFTTHDIFLIACGSIIGLFIWYLILELYMVLTYKVKWKKNLILIVISFTCFILTSTIPNNLIALLIYIGFVILVGVFLFADIKKVYGKIK